jgi:undecaprenyl-diphosphatase
LAVKSDGVLRNVLTRLWQRVLSQVSRRERTELRILLGALGVLALTIAFVYVAENVTQGDTRDFDERVLRALRRSDDPGSSIGPAWLQTGALDITALGSPTVLGLVVLAVTGYLLIHKLYRTGAFVFVASCGGWFLNWALKLAFDRPRPDLVPHLREVMSSSFPSGHAMTSAAVYLTLGTLLMRLVEGRLAKFYCIAIAMLATLLVGASRVFLGVHYPTDVLAGWLIGLSWALVCWMIERAVERRAGLKREQRQYQQEA